MLPYHLCSTVAREERGELSSVTESGIAFTFRSRKRWRTHACPYKITYVTMQEKKEKFCCHQFLLSHPERTQECLRCLSHFSYKKELVLSSLQGVKRQKVILQNKLCQKLLLWKKEIFSQSNCFATLTASVFVSISHRWFASLLFLALSHMHKIQMENLH